MLRTSFRGMLALEKSSNGGAARFARVSTYEGGNPLDQDASLRFLQEHVIPTARGMAGWKGAYFLADAWGGFIALLTALRYPDLVRCLTVEEPPVIPLFMSTPPKPQEIIKVLLTRTRTGAALVGFMARGFVRPTAR